MNMMSHQTGCFFYRIDSIVALKVAICQSSDNRLNLKQRMNFQ